MRTDLFHMVLFGLGQGFCSYLDKHMQKQVSFCNGSNLSSLNTSVCEWVLNGFEM